MELDIADKDLVFLGAFTHHLVEDKVSTLGDALPLIHHFVTFLLVIPFVTLAGLNKGNLLYNLIWNWTES